MEEVSNVLKQNKIRIKSKLILWVITSHSRAYIKIALITVIKSCLGVLKILAERISRSVVCGNIRFLCAKILHKSHNLNCYIVCNAKNLQIAYCDDLSLTWWIIKILIWLIRNESKLKWKILQRILYCVIFISNLIQFLSTSYRYFIRLLLDYNIAWFL